MKVEKKQKAKEEPVQVPTGDVVSLYDKYEQTARGRASTGGASEAIRQFAADLFVKKGTDRLVLSALIKVMADETGMKIQNGTARSALKKDYKLEKDDQGRVWIVKA